MKKFGEKFFYIDTLYSLFICLLLENDLDKNFYFFSGKFPRIVMKNLRNKIIIKEIKVLKIITYLTGAIFFRIIRLLFYKKLRIRDFIFMMEQNFLNIF